MLSDKAAQAEAANSFQKGGTKKQKLQIPFGKVVLKGTGV